MKWKQDLDAIEKRIAISTDDNILNIVYTKVSSIEMLLMEEAISVSEEYQKSLIEL